MANEENLTPFKPGQSGNPKGKPKGILNSKTILKKLMALDSPAKNPITGEKMNCFEHILVKITQNAMNGNLKAARELIDRLEGKPKQSLDVTPRTPDDVEQMTNTELKEKSLELINKLREKLDRSDPKSNGDK